MQDELDKAAMEQVRHENQERLRKLEEDELAANKKRLEEEREGIIKVEEAERLEEENKQVSAMKGARKQNLEYQEKIIRDKRDWQKFVSCTSRPNVAFENEITTYITMVREERVQSMEDAMRKCRESEDMVGDLMELYCKAREEGASDRQEWCQKYINLIRVLEVELMDAATKHFLQYIENAEINNHWQVCQAWGDADDDIKCGFWGNLQGKRFHAKEIDHSKIQVGLALPKTIALPLQSLSQGGGSAGPYIGVRSFYTSYDSSHGKDPTRMSVGGMIRVDLLSIPPFSRKVGTKGWTLRQIPDPDQEMRIPYPNTDPNGNAGITYAPCKIEYKVPSRVLVRKNPTISWWDTTAETWSNDGITDITWEPDMRKISFYTRRLASFAITQERHIDLPYQWWVMRPVGPKRVKLTVQAARLELDFVISEDGLWLKGPEEIEELKSIMYEDAPCDEDPTGQEAAGKPKRVPRVRSPATLLCDLRECGINLLPENGDAEFLEGYQPKCTDTQARAYSDLSEVAATYDIASSRHNKMLPKEQALVRVRENLHREVLDPLDPDCDSDYQGIMFFPDKACFVQSLEGKPCSEKLKDGHVTHASLYLCYEKPPVPPQNNQDLLQHIEVNLDNVRFVEAVRQTMALMRLLCFV